MYCLIKQKTLEQLGFFWDCRNTLFGDRMCWAPLSSEYACVLWWGWERWGPSLGPSLLFFPGQSQRPFVSWPPLPPFFPWFFPHGHREVWPLNSPSRLLCAQSQGAPQKCRLSLSTHSPAAGGQQGLSTLSDPGPERSGRKGVQPVGCKALVDTC